MAKTRDILVSCFTVNCSDPGRCWARSCMHPGVNKGVYNQGRGYVRYYETPIPECMTRHLHGCPHPLPEVDLENARCCFRPDYPIRHPSGQRFGKKVLTECRTCGSKAPVGAATLINTLPTLPGVKCRHESEDLFNLIRSAWTCLGCRGYWDHRPHPFEESNLTEQGYDDRVTEVLSKIKT